MGVVGIGVEVEDGVLRNDEMEFVVGGEVIGFVGFGVCVVVG